NMVQSNTIASALNNTFGLDTRLIGTAIFVLTTAVVLGGIKRIAAVANKLIPFMIAGYMAAVTVVLLVHAGDVPAGLGLILTSAFSPVAATGGFAGAAVMAAIRFGVARGIFSNEAGLGTAGIVQAAGQSKSAVQS